MSGIHKGIQLLSRFNVFFALAIGAAILLLTTIFVATTGDSMSYSIAVVGAGHDQPHFLIRAFWGAAMAIMAGILLYMGDGQISVLQQFIVITAIPVSIIILPTLWTGPQTAMAMAREQRSYCSTAIAPTISSQNAPAGLTCRDVLRLVGRLVVALKRAHIIMPKVCYG